MIALFASDVMFNFAVDFLGRAAIPMQELRRLPSSRQILPLTGKPGASSTSGSVTVEVSSRHILITRQRLAVTSSSCSAIFMLLVHVLRN